MNTFLRLFHTHLRKDKWLIYGVVIVFIQISLYFVFHKSIFSYPDYQESYANAGIEFFYYVHSIGLHPYIFICMLLLLPNMLSSDFLNNEKKHVHYFIETRITKKKYYWYSFIQNMIMSFISALLIEIMIYFTIHIFYLPINFNTMTYPKYYHIITQLICSNEVYNIIIFMVITSLGYSIVSALLFTIQKLINNLYVYRSCGVIIGIMLVLLPALMQGYFPNPDFPILFQINNLVCLGIEGVMERPFGLSYIWIYVICFVFYCCVSFIGAKCYQRWREKYD